MTTDLPTKCSYEKQSQGTQQITCRQCMQVKNPQVVSKLIIKQPPAARSGPCVIFRDS